MEPVEAIRRLVAPRPAPSCGTSSPGVAFGRPWSGEGCCVREWAVVRVLTSGSSRASNPFESVLRAIALDVAGLGVRPQVGIALASGARVRA